MKYNELLSRLKRLKVETGSLACSGCDAEHNCGTEGCRIIREAKTLLEELHGVIQNGVDSCDLCANNVEVPGCDVECMTCRLDCACKDCRDGSSFVLKEFGVRNG